MSDRKSPAEKLEVALSVLRHKQPTVTGLGIPIHIIKEVIEELKRKDNNNDKGN